MPTARELLEQVDALMRRNRRDDAVRVPSAPAAVDPLTNLLPDVSTLSDTSAVDHDALLAPTVILPAYGAPAYGVPAIDGPGDVVRDALAVPQGGQQTPGSGLRDAAWLGTLADLPILTDVVDVGETPSLLASTPESPAPESPAAESPAAESPAAEPADQAPTAQTNPQRGAEWDALADEIRAQVLQRLDLFTDTGLREQLGARLQPIVDRASAELVDTINRQLGELVRGYVAEAIEREIEAWRNRSA
ncbi:MAG: hypothetical protein ACREX6_06665 [Casimicrobiaceae bacterium]